MNNHSVGSALEAISKCSRGALHRAGGGRAAALMMVHALVAFVFFGCARISPLWHAPATDAPGTAVVRIETEGTFLEIGGDQLKPAEKGGSGFLISSEGEILTNAHVVVGAALLRVFVPGEPVARPGRVVRSDACSDLALIKIDGGNYPYLKLGVGDPAVQAPVVALGYPEPTLVTTRGVVADVRADGALPWVAVRYTIQHTAEILPGNSGGPLVAENGTVVGINYAGDDLGAAYAVPVSIVNELLPMLRGDAVQGFYSGINAEATSPGDTAGAVFVRSVASGSPADKAGVMPGDLVTELEHLPMAEDGTLQKYCDVLRSHGQTDVLSVKVYRPVENQMLSGQLNGIRLAVVEGPVEGAVDEAGNPVAAPAAPKLDMDSPPVPPAQPVSGEGILFDLGTMVINLADPGGRRYLKVGIVLEFAPHDTAWYTMATEQRAELQALFETEMGTKQPAIEKLVISIISSKSFKQVYSLEGKEAVRQELVNGLNQMLPTQLVMYVYFNEFVVQ